MGPSGCASIPKLARPAARGVLIHDNAEHLLNPVAALVERLLGPNPSLLDAQVRERHLRLSRAMSAAASGGPQVAAW
jgi:hypothetical protein